jgi:hypothetical protein
MLARAADALDAHPRLALVTGRVLIEAGGRRVVPAGVERHLRRLERGDGGPTASVDEKIAPEIGWHA